MTKAEKLLAKFKNSPQNLRFNEIKLLAESLGFDFVQGKGSHILCFMNTQLVMTFPIHNDDCKDIYKKKFLKIISS